MLFSGNIHVRVVGANQVSVWHIDFLSLGGAAASVANEPHKRARMITIHIITMIAGVYIGILLSALNRL